MRLFYGILMLLLAVPVAAQEPDSLDWHRYAPLAVGNAWQYRETLGTYPFPTTTVFQVAEIVGVRRVDGLPHAEVVECGRAVDDPTPCNTSGPRTLVRYDEPTASVIKRYEVNGEVYYRPWAHYPCGLDAPEGKVETTCPDDAPATWFVDIEPYEEANVLGTTLSTPGAFKTYATLASGLILQSDVGLLTYCDGDPDCSGGDLIYVRIDGVEYGTPAVVVASEDAVPPEPAALSVFPNPLREAATLRFSLAAPERLTLDVFDVRGRRVRTVALGVRGAGAHEVRFAAGDLAPGAYRLRLTGDGGFEAARGIIITP